MPAASDVLPPSPQFRHCKDGEVEWSESTVMVAHNGPSYFEAQLGALHSAAGILWVWLRPWDDAAYSYQL